MHQVALSQWVLDGMRTKPEKLIEQIHRQFIRSFCVPEKMLELLRDYESGAL